MTKINKQKNNDTKKKLNFINEKKDDLNYYGIATFTENELKNKSEIADIASDDNLSIRAITLDNKQQLYLRKVDSNITNEKKIELTAKKLYNDSDFKNSLKAYKELLKITNESPETYSILGALYTKIGDLSAAINHYIIALSLTSDESIKKSLIELINKLKKIVKKETNVERYYDYDYQEVLYRLYQSTNGDSKSIIDILKNGLKVEKYNNMEEKIKGELRAKGIMLITFKIEENINVLNSLLKKYSDIDILFIHDKIAFLKPKLNYDINIKEKCHYGIHEYKTGNYKMALKIFQSAFNSFNSKDDICEALGLTYAKLGDYETSKNYFIAAANTSLDESRKKRCNERINQINELEKNETIKKITDTNFFNSCVKEGLVNDKKALTALIFARYCFIEGENEIANEYLKIARNLPNVSENVDLLYEEIMDNKEYFSGSIDDNISDKLNKNYKLFLKNQSKNLDAISTVQKIINVHDENRSINKNLHKTHEKLYNHS